MTRTPADRPIVCFGEALVDLFPAPGAGDGAALAEVDRFERQLGGAPCNVAVGLARLGVPVAFIGQVGDDAFGEFIRGALVSEGVDVGALSRSPRRTALAFVGRDEQGEPTFLFYRERSADASLQPQAIDACAELLAGAAAVHLGTNTSSVEPCASATRRLVALCGQHAVPLSLDLNLRLHLWDDPRRGVDAARELAGKATLLKASAEEAAKLSGICDDGPAAARALAQLGPELVVVTHGAGGATFAHGGREGHVSAPVTELVDSTGAGDAFCAALLAALQQQGALADVAAAHHDVIERSVARACVAAAAVCTAVGATAGLVRELPEL